MNRRRPVVLVSLLCLAAVVLLLIGVALHRGRNGNRATSACAQNLTQIGLALSAYASQNDGRLPDDLAALLPAVDIASHVLVCPATQATPAVASSVERAVAMIRLADHYTNIHDLPRPNHCSYAYRGKGQTLPLPAGQVLAFEPLANHDGDGVNVLFGNGEVRFVDKKDVEGLLNP